MAETQDRRLGTVIGQIVVLAEAEVAKATDVSEPEEDES